MNSIRLFDRRVVYIVAAIAMLLATFIPALVSAAQVTERSVQLSSSSVTASGVSYKVNFKSVQTAGAFVVDFCSNTPLVSEACTAPGGLNVGTPASSTSGFTAVGKLTNNANNAVRVTGSIAANTAYSVDITGLTNPSATGPLYARIITFDTAGNANSYDSTSTGVTEGAGGVRDTGSVALYITPSVAVSGAVLESMTFCVSAAAPTANCGGISSPVLKLGEENGGVIALSPGVISTGDIFTQISTNADGGAVVSLKSSALNCGGLLRAGSTDCDITPALDDGINATTDAKFGVLAAADTDPTGGSSNGTFRTVVGSNYNASTYALNYVAGNATGVTSTYGDPFLDTNDAPINNKNMKLTFGASVQNNTPAGLYSADLSMIATGKF